MTTAILAVAWLLGIATAAHTGADPVASIAAASLLGAATFAWRPRLHTLLVLPLAFVLVFVALARYDATTPAADNGLISLAGSGEVRLRGEVGEEPQDRNASRVNRLADLQISERGEWISVDGKILVRLPAHSQYEYGDIIEATGEVEVPENTSDFDYRAYLLRQGVSAQMNYPETRLVASGGGEWHRERLFDLRDDLSEALDDALPQPHASLAGGVLFGSRDTIPADLRDAMAATGTSHLVAVSGQNVSILAGLVIAAFAWLIGRRPAALLALGVIAGYTLLVGLDASVVRAAIMGGLFVGAIIAGRQDTAWIALLIAAAAMTALDPQVVHDVGFQLSFAATLGLIALAPRLYERLDAAAIGVGDLRRFPLYRPALETGTVTLSAIAFTLPITAMTFERISVVAPLANLFAVPAFLAVAGTAAIATALTVVVPSADGVAAVIAWLPAEYMIRVVELFAGLPIASVSWEGFRLEYAISWYAALGALVWWLATRPVDDPEPVPMVRFRLAPALGIAAPALIAGALLWLLVSDDDDDRLTVTFLDVGQGDAMLIETPDDHRVLIDGGPTDSAITTALGRNLPFYDRRIDLVVLTHPQEDHVGGLLEVLDEYDVRAILNSPAQGETGLAGIWDDLLDSSDSNVTSADAGQRVDLGSGTTLEVLSPDAGDPLFETTPINEASTVMRLSVGDVTFLLTADIGAPAEEALLRSGIDLEADVLKVGHHGSRFSSTPEFLARVGPRISVISAGEDNVHGHPTPETLARLPGEVFRTDEDGDVTVSTDGERIWVETGR